MKEIIKIDGFVYSEGVNITKLNESQRDNKLIISSDYIYLLLFTEGINLNSARQISIDKQNPIVEIDSFLNLEWLLKEFQYDSSNEELSYRTNFIKIANTYSQDFLLIGNTIVNYNEIHFYSYSKDETQYICSSLFTFINEYLL